MATYLITGASRGIGLELIKQLLDCPVDQVGRIFAASRDRSSTALQDVLAAHPERTRHVLISTNDDASVKAAVQQVEKELGSKGLDVLVNGAAIQKPNPEGTRTMPPQQMLEILDVNVVGTHRMIAAFLPLLQKGNLKRVITLSSSVGSMSWVERFKMAPHPDYKISKAALNMLNQQYAMDLAEEGFTFLLVSPGWLKTELGGPYADLEVPVGVTALKKVILETTPKANGKFVNILVPGWEETAGQYDGKEIPW